MTPLEPYVDVVGSAVYYQSKSKTMSRFMTVEIGILVYEVQRGATWSGGVEWSGGSKRRKKNR